MSVDLAYCPTDAVHDGSSATGARLAPAPTGTDSGFDPVSHPAADGDPSGEEVARKP